MSSNEEEKKLIILPDDYTDELDEDEEEGYEFKPDKPKLSQFLPIVLFGLIFSLFGIDFFVRNEIKNQWIEEDEPISTPFSVISPCGTNKIVPKHLKDNTNLQNTYFFSNDTLCVPTGDRLAFSQCSIDDFIQKHNEELLVIIANQEAQEKILYKHRNCPYVKGIRVSSNESFIDLLHTRYERLKLPFLYE